MPSEENREDAETINMAVGTRLKLQRKRLGITQTQLGDLLGITFQQIQKYERGANRISAGYLYILAKALRVPVSYFFDGSRGALTDFVPLTER
jgi:transcriptional regulator with XRE-family HTH domain